jgi:hypothetical protein
VDGLIILSSIAFAAGVPSTLVVYRAITRCDREGLRLVDVLLPTSLIVALIWLPAWAAIAYMLGGLPQAAMLIPVTAPLAVLLGSVTVRAFRFEPAPGVYGYSYLAVIGAGGAIGLAYVPHLALLLSEYI